MLLMSYYIYSSKLHVTDHLFLETCKQTLTKLQNRKSFEDTAVSWCTCALDAMIQTVFNQNHTIKATL